MHYAVIGLGFGDEGKGITVARLAEQFDIDWVVRYSGGSQAGHNVIHNGRKHCFRQFGSGTFSGARTYMTHTAVFDPWAFERERLALRNFGVDTDSMFHVHPRALVVTPYHVLANRARNAASGHGTVGMGIGETKFYAGAYAAKLGKGEFFGNHECPSDTFGEPLRAGHLRDKDRTAAILHQMREFYRPLIGDTIYEPDIVAETFCEGIYKRFHVHSQDDGLHAQNVVWESSQGVLLDQQYGFHPHTTWSDLTTKPIRDIIGPNAPLHTIGVTRTYHTRHGAGPFFGEDADLTAKHDEPDNHDKGIQGRFRVGPLVLPLLSYGIDVVKPDSLSVTHLDKDYGVYPDVNRKNADSLAMTLTSLTGLPISMAGTGPGVEEGILSQETLDKGVLAVVDW